MSMEDINKLRKTLENIDDALLRLAKKRFETVKCIWSIKKDNNIKLRDKESENKKIKMMKKHGLDDGFVEKMFSLIFDENEKMFENHLK